MTVGRRYLRCPECRTLVLKDERFLYCYACGGTLEHARLVNFGSIVEPIVQRDFKSSRWGMMFMAILGTYGVLHVVLAYEPIPGIVRVGLLAPLVFAVMIGALIARRSKNVELQAAGKVVVGLASALGMAMATLAVIGVAGFILLFIVCAMEGGM